MARTLILITLMATAILFAFSEQSQDAAHESQPEPWQALVGKPAPDWFLENWINSEPLSVGDLKGKVVLIRWWLESCPYCRATAPALNEFYKNYSDRGLVVIGIYHPKPKGRKATEEQVKLFTQEKGFNFPVAIDCYWQTLEKFWPPNIDMKFTSVSFLIDREGVIRYIHPGGSYNSEEQPFNNPQWKQDYIELKHTLEALL